MNNLTIGDFEGPLDLLLHLVKQSKIEISELSLVNITEKYINFIKNMETLDLDVASEYLVMAAELIEMKSRFLLPSKQAEDIEEDFEVDPEEELKRRLLEYQKIKGATGVLKTLEENRSSYYTKSPERINKYSESTITNETDITVNDLLNAFKAILERKNYSRPINTKIARKELSVKERVVKIREMLKLKKKVSFEELFDDFSRPYVVVTFLSVLEMAKNREIVIKQENNFENIFLERVD